MNKWQGEGTVFVDLFGGSRLVSHTLKQVRLDCKVVYNDYDNYSERLANEERTNALLRHHHAYFKNVLFVLRIIKVQQYEKAAT